MAAALLFAPIAVGLSAWPAKPPAAAPPVLVAQAQGKQPATAPLATFYKKWLDEDVAFIIAGEERDALAQAQGRQPATAPLATPYEKWLTEDVAYIITNQERTAFKSLTTDEEREHFIEQFWQRRDPTPDTLENEFKEEHYRRIAYANQHFAERVPGWKTDRGRIYIVYGPPDEIDARRAGPTPVDTYPVQQWRYRFIEGIGENVIIEFVDATGTGEFHMTMDPSDKDRLLHEPGAGPGAADAARPEALLALVAALDKQIYNEEATLAKLKLTYTDDHPEVRTAKARLEYLIRTREAWATRHPTP
jgi:GWxTD domain-containing protein